MSIYRVGPNGDPQTLNVQTRTSDTVIQWETSLSININHFVSITAGGQTFLASEFNMVYTGNPDDHQNGSITLNTGTFPASVINGTTITGTYRNTAEGDYHISGANNFSDFVNVIETANELTPTLNNQQGFTNLTIASSDSKDTITENVTYNGAKLTINSGPTSNNDHLRVRVNTGTIVLQAFGPQASNGVRADGSTGHVAEVGEPVARPGAYICIALNQGAEAVASDFRKILPKAWEICTFATEAFEVSGTGSEVIISLKDGTSVTNINTLNETGGWNTDWDLTSLSGTINRSLKPNEAYIWDWAEGSTLTIDGGKTIQFANASLPLMSAKDGTFNITDGSQVELTTQVKRFIPGSIASNGDGSQTVLATTANPFTLNIKNNSSFQINNITTTTFSDQAGSSNTFLGTPNSVSTRNLVGTFENSSLVDTSDGQTLVYPLADSIYNNFTILLDKGGSVGETASNQFFLTCNPNARIRDSFKVVNTGFASRFRFTGIAAANNTLADGSTYSVNKANTIAGSLNSQLIWYRFNLVSSSTTELGLYNPGNINFIFINPKLNNDPYYGKYNFTFRHPTNNFRDGNVVLAIQYNPIFQYSGSALNKISEELYYGDIDNSTLITVKEASESGLINTIGTQYNDATGVTISSTFGLADVNYTANEATAGTEFTSTNSNNNGLNLTFLKTVTEPSGTTVTDKDYDTQDTHFFSYQKRDGFRPTFPRYSFADGAKEALIVPKDPNLDLYWQNSTTTAIDSYVELLKVASPTGTYNSVSNTLSINLDLDTDQETVDTSNIGVTDAAVIKNSTPGDYSIFITDNSGINVNDIHILTNGAAEYTATVIGTDTNGQVDINVSTADSALIDAVAGSKTSGGFTYWSASAGFGLDIKAHTIDWNDVYKTIEYLENNNLITNANLTSDTRTDTTKYNKHFHRFIDTDTPVDSSGRINMPDYNLKLTLNSTKLEKSTDNFNITGINMGTNTLDITSTIDLTVEADIICKTLTDTITSGKILNYRNSTITTTTDLTVDGSVLNNSILNITGDLVIDDITNSTANISETYTGRNATGSDLNITKGVTLTGNATGNTINGTSIAITGTVNGDTIIGSAAYSSGAISNGTNISGVTTVTLNGDVDDSTISSSGNITGSTRDINSSTLTSSTGDITINDSTNTTNDLVCNITATTGDIIMDDSDDCTLISGADMTIKNLVDSTATAGATYGGSTNTRSTINSTGAFTMTNSVTGTSTNKAIMNLGANGTFSQTITNGNINGISSSAQTITLNGSSIAAPHMSVMITGTNVKAIINTPIEDSDIGTATTRVNDADFHNDASVIDTNAYATNTIDLPTTTSNGIFNSSANIVQSDSNGTVSSSTLTGVDINIKAMTGGTITSSDDVVITSANGTTINCNDSLTNSGDFTNVNVTTAILSVNDIKGAQSLVTTSGNATINEIEAGSINFNGSTSTSTIGTISGGTITSNNTHQLDITTLENGIFDDGELDVTNFVENGTFTDLTFEDVKTNTKATAHTGVYSNVDLELTNAGNVTLGGSGDVTATEGPNAEDYTDKYVQTGSDRTQFEVLTTTGGDINDTITIFSEGVEIVANAHLFDTPELTGTRAGGYVYTVGNIAYEQTQTLQQNSPPLFIYGVTKVDTSKRVIINPQSVTLTIVPDDGTNNTRHIIRAELPFDVTITADGATRVAYKINDGTTVYVTPTNNTFAFNESSVNRGDDIEVALEGIGYSPRYSTFTISNLPENGTQNINLNLNLSTYATAADTGSTTYTSTEFNSSNELVMTMTNITQDPIAFQRLVLDNIYTSDETLDAMLHYNSSSIVEPISNSISINTAVVKLKSTTAITRATKETAPLITPSQTTDSTKIIEDEIKLVNQGDFLGISHLSAQGLTPEELNEELNRRKLTSGTLKNAQLLIPKFGDDQ